MNRTNSGMLFSLSRKRSIRLPILFCIVLLILEVSFTFKNRLSSVPRQDLYSNSNGILNCNTFVMKNEEKLDEGNRSRSQRKINEFAKTHLSGLNFTAGIAASKQENTIFRSANEALEQGRKLWQELELNEKNRNSSGVRNPESNTINKLDDCPDSISVSGDEFAKNGRVVVLPCGLTSRSHITVVGKPRAAHVETKTKTKTKTLASKGGQHLMISQFMLELQGMVEGEEPPRILHLNPRLKGDSSGKPVIVHNTCYRMMWRTPQRCEGWKSRADEETVDGFAKCEKWTRDDGNGSEGSKTTWRWNSLSGQTKKDRIEWPFPFAEGKSFVLNLSAGSEGYHVIVDGRHVTSFPYRTEFSLEDVARLSLNGDVDVQSIYVASLPTSHPQKHLDMSEVWKAPPIPDGPVEMFVGILSAGNHFVERMAVRKSWMQHQLIKSSYVVARFFVALHARKEVNEEVKKEAEFFGDVVVVPYKDHYDLVVLKTLAICEYGVRTVSADYIMKCDDDTFVRVDAILDEAKKVQGRGSLYSGNLNYNRKPVRNGSKWRVTNEEWPEEGFPPFASGPGYVISSDIANSIVSDFEKHKLRLFKLEDICMGMWVEKVNKSRSVEYVHSSKFCWFGCVEDYLTAHYQSPGQMICLWNKLKQQGRPSCCNM